MRTNAAYLALGLFVFLAPSPVLADKILLIGGSDSTDNAAMQAVLQATGNSVTLGPSYTSFTGAGLSGYNAVILLPNGQYWNGVDMPASGQQALVNFVQNGGGLVTNEAIDSMVSGVGGNRVFQTLSPLLPMNQTNVNTGNAPIVMSALSSNAVLNAGLPSSFAIPAQGYDTETLYTPKPGASAFFSTNQWTTSFGGEGVGYGVLGWNYGAGRVISLSTFSDLSSLGNSNYDQLVTNAVNWASESSGGSSQPAPPAVPEPQTLFVLCAGLIGLVLKSRAGKFSR